MSRIFDINKNTSTLGLFYNSGTNWELLGYLDDIPNFTSQAQYGREANDTLLNGLQSMVVGTMGVLENVISSASSTVGINTNISGAMDKLIERVPNIAKNALALQGISMDGGTMSRQFYTGGQYLRYDFSLDVPTDIVKNVHEILSKFMYPSEIGDVGALESFIASLMSPSMLLNKDGEISFDSDEDGGSALGTLIGTLGTQLSSDSLKAYANDSFVSDKGSTNNVLEVITKKYGDVPKEVREALFVLKSIADEPTKGSGSGVVTSPTIKLYEALNDSSESGLPTELLNLHRSGKDVSKETPRILKRFKIEPDLIDQVTLAVTKTASTATQILGTPVETLIKMYTNSAMSAPKKIEFSSLRICSVGGDGSRLREIDARDKWADIIPKPKSSGFDARTKGSALSSGNKFVVRDVSMNPSDDISSTSGKPLSYKMRISLETSQITLKDDLVVGSPSNVGGNTKQNNLDLTDYNNALKNRRTQR
jgi:hypothetical protein